MQFKFRTMTLWVAIIGLTLLACDIGSLIASKPTTVITSPPSGSQFREGEDVAVQSTSTDSSGILRVEMAVDSNVVRTDSAPSPQVSFSQIQTWKATAGTHTITVRSFNTGGNASEPAAISITVTPAGGATTAPSVAPSVQSPRPVTPGSVPSATAPTTGTAAATPAGACTNAAAFVTDVTVPDGTALAAGQTFNKIWRVRNTGTCTWGTGYQFVFVGGESMTTATAAVVPDTAPNATADLLIPMAAPASPGTHSGRWQLKSATGQTFGPQVNVTISTVGAPATQTAAPACTGQPSIAFFTVTPFVITSGQSATLNYGLVSNAEEATIEPGIGGVTTPGSVVVTPTTTTTYTLTARCGANVKTAQVTVTVTGGTTSSAGTLTLDLLASAPAATWYSGANDVSTGYLTWGDAANVGGTNPQGYMRWVDNARLEDNSTAGRVLETAPKMVDNGFLVGRYNLPTPIQAGTHFRARFGFRQGATGKVEFIAGIVLGGTAAGGGNPVRIVDVAKQPTGSLLSADVDLSPYAGQTVQVFLQTIAQNPGGTQDFAVWLSPRLER